MTDRLNSGGTRPPKRSPQEWCDRGNALLAGTEPTTKGEYPKPRTDVEWKVWDGRVTIGWRKTAFAMNREDFARKPLMDRRGQPMSESDTFALNKELESLGATARYRPDGSRYTIA
jgi:hypothetical protein